MRPAEIELERALANRPDHTGPRAEDARFLAMSIDATTITLSTFAQLDTVRYDRCRPVARVQPPMSGRYAIAADPEGWLVRTSFDAAWPQQPTTGAYFRAVMDRLRVLRRDQPERVAEIHQLEAIETDRFAYEVALEDHMALPLVILARGGKK